MAEWSLSESTAEPGLPQPSAKMSQRAVEPRMRVEPSWFKDYVT